MSSTSSLGTKLFDVDRVGAFQRDLVELFLLEQYILALFEL